MATMSSTTTAISWKNPSRHYAEKTLVATIKRNRLVRRRRRAVAAPMTTSPTILLFLPPPRTTTMTMMMHDTADGGRKFAVAVANGPVGTS
jgi:hypothetical protein